MFPLGGGGGGGRGGSSPTRMLPSVCMHSPVLLYIISYNYDEKSKVGAIIEPVIMYGTNISR